MSDKNAAISLARKYKVLADKVRARAVKLAEDAEPRPFDSHHKGPIRSGADLALFALQKKGYEALARDAETVARGLRLGLMSVPAAQQTLAGYERDLKRYEQERKDAAHRGP